MPDVSVIVPVYNVEKYIRRCLDSLLNQSCEGYELLLIDDGSTDRSGLICDEYQRSDSRVRVIHQENQGIGATRNKGLDESRGDYIYFCDADDYVEPDLLRDNVRVMKEKNANMVVFSYYDEKTETHGVKRVVRKPEHEAFFEKRNEFRAEFSRLHLQMIMYTLWNKMYKRSYLINNHCRFEDIAFGEDTRFNYSVYKDIDRVYISKGIYYHYIVQRTDSAANTYRPDYFTNRYQEVLKLEELVASWGMSEENDRLLCNEWITTLILGIKSVFHKNCPFNDEEKKDIIQKLFNQDKIQHAIKNSSFSSFSGSLRDKVKKLIFINANRRSGFLILKLIYK